MHLIVCIEDNDGMSFCGRRLSSDRIVIERINTLTSGANLWMNQYSARLFSQEKVRVDEAFLQKAFQGDYCFVENIPLPTDEEVFESVILYCWNRRYPATLKFPREILKNKEQDYTEEFSGYSHDKITMEIYR